MFFTERFSVSLKAISIVVRTCAITEARAGKSALQLLFDPLGLQNRTNRNRLRMSKIPFQDEHPPHLHDPDDLACCRSIEGSYDPCLRHHSSEQIASRMDDSDKMCRGAHGSIYLGWCAALA